MSTAEQTQQILAAIPLPRTFKEKVQADLTDALRKGFLIDLDQLCVNLRRLAVR